MWIPALVSAALLVFVAGSASSESESYGAAAALKCGSSEPPVVLVDGELRDSMAMAGLVAEDVHSVRILCWNPADSTFGWKTGTGVTVLQITRHSFLATLRTGLDALGEAQRTHFEAHGRHASRLTELGMEHLVAGGVEVAIEVSPDGWSATAQRPAMVERCRVTGAAPAACELHVDPTRKVALAGR